MKTPRKPRQDCFIWTKRAASRHGTTSIGRIFGTIIVKDHSRLGRNRLVVGQLLEEDFNRMEVRYIAIMDNIDTAKGISDLVPMRDLFNETFMLVQELREHRRRPTRSGIISMFSGMPYCADCGEKLYYSTVNSYKREQAYFFYSSYRKNSDVCSAHYIREKVVAKAVLESMQRVFWYV